MSRNNNAWSTPKLKVLVRGNPEEKVLTSCKGTGYDGPIDRPPNDCQIPNGGSCEGLGNS